MTVPHQSETSVHGRTGFSKISGLLASVRSVSCPKIRTARLQRIVWELFARTGTFASQSTIKGVSVIRESSFRGLNITAENILPSVVSCGASEC